MIAFALFLSTFAQAVGPAAGCEANVEIVNAETRQSIPGLLRAKNTAGEPLEISGLLSRGEGLEAAHPARQWFVLPARSIIRLPCGPVVFEAIAGVESHLTQARTALRPGHTAKLQIPLPFFSNVTAEGWRAGNTHLHLQKLSRSKAERYLKEVPAADGLQVLFLSYLERADVDRDYVTNGYSDADLAELTHSTGVIFGSGEEQRHNFSSFGEGYGHQLFLNVRKLIRPVSIGPGIMKWGTDGWPLQTGADMAREQGATVLWCHNTQGTEGVASVILERAQAVNIFDGDPAEHGLYADTFYRFLNVGLRVPFSTGTDWFLYDFSRVYVHVPDMRDAGDWLKPLTEGRSFITNGALLSLHVGDQTIGDTLDLAAHASVPVRAKAVARMDFGALEVIRNGKVIASVAASKQGDTFVAEFNAAVDIAESSWLTARVPPNTGTTAGVLKNELGAPLFAHTSPVYVNVAGRKTFVRADAEFIRKQLLGQQMKVATTGVFASAAEKQRVLNVYALALARLEAALKVDSW
ncbi:MAG: CehA/McbA family metallohydrolase [Deltaproteobacteria bacterium]|nr:CehA/McbA family metallohydrolase [Deltaproteobacteria bacterium]